MCEYVHARVSDVAKFKLANESNVLSASVPARVQAANIPKSLKVKGLTPLLRPVCDVLNLSLSLILPTKFNLPRPTINNLTLPHCYKTSII